MHLEKFKIVLNRKIAILTRVTFLVQKRMLRSYRFIRFYKTALIKFQNSTRISVKVIKLNFETARDEALKEKI